MLPFILGYFIDEHVDASVLGFLSFFVRGQPPAVIFYFSHYIFDRIHEQLVKFLIEGVFRYTSFLFHMFLYFQSENFPITLQNLDLEENPQSVVF